jgi:hypothetical protein
MTDPPRTHRTRRPDAEGGRRAREPAPAPDLSFGWRERAADEPPIDGGRPDGRGAGPDPAGAGAEPDPTAEWRRMRDAGLFGAAPGADAGPPPPGGAPSLAALVALLEALRGVVPQELERQFTALLREALLTIRALIDWYLERLDGGPEERRMEDIPID